MKSLLRYIPVILWMLLIFLFSSIQNLRLTGDLSAYDLILRKLAHITEYTILYGLWWYALEKKAPVSRMQNALVFTIVYAMTDETHQHFVPTRDGKVIDILIDSIGAIAGLVLITINRSKLKNASDSDKTSL